MNKFDELRNKINTEYRAVTNSIKIGNSEYAFAWAVLDALNNYVEELIVRIYVGHMSQETAFSRLCVRVNTQYDYCVDAAYKFDNDVHELNIAKGIFFSMMNAMNEIIERNN